MYCTAKSAAPMSLPLLMMALFSQKLLVGNGGQKRKKQIKENLE
jgi:hypothetical protein